MQFTLKAFVLAFVAAFATNVAAAPAPLPVPEPLKPLRAADNACYYKRDEEGAYIGYKRDVNGVEARSPGCAAE